MLGARGEAPSADLSPTPTLPALLPNATGASLVELYSAFAYEGPKLVPRVKAELAALLERDGFASVADAVGADHRQAPAGAVEAVGAAAKA